MDDVQHSSAGAEEDQLTIREYRPGMMVFGRYELKSLLGRGGMGVVWLAWDAQLERQVALKFLPDVVAYNRGAVEELKRETKRALELTHPHLVRIYDFLRAEDNAGISMEYVDGDTLANLRVERPGRCFDVRELREWIGQLCEALDYAHRKGKVVHRDLKPANLMVNRQGDLKVADFGIARSLSESVSRVSRSGRGTSGTLAYMSPQQLEGDPPSVGDDIYAFGATLYELLTSKPPFQSGLIDHQIRERKPTPLEERRRQLGVEGKEPIPPEWESVVQACLAKKVADRPHGALEIAYRLGLRADLPETASEAPAATAKVARWRWLTPRTGLASAGIALLLVAGWGIHRWTNAPDRQPPPPPPTAEPSKGTPPRPQPDIPKPSSASITPPQAAPAVTPAVVTPPIASGVTTPSVNPLVNPPVNPLVKPPRDTPAVITPPANPLVTTPPATPAATAPVATSPVAAPTTPPAVSTPPPPALPQPDRSAAAENENRYQGLANGARQALEAGRYDDAIHQADLALLAKPEDPLAARLKAQAETERSYLAASNAAQLAFHARQYDEAIHQADLALRSKPNDPAAMRLRAEAEREKSFLTASGAAQKAFDARDYDEAIRQADLALQSRPNDPVVSRLKSEAESARRQAAKPTPVKTNAAVSAVAKVSDLDRDLKGYEQAFRNLRDLERTTQPDLLRSNVAACRKALLLMDSIYRSMNLRSGDLRDRRRRVDELDRRLEAWQGRK